MNLCFAVSAHAAKGVFLIIDGTRRRLAAAMASICGLVVSVLAYAYSVFAIFPEGVLGRGLILLLLGSIVLLLSIFVVEYPTSIRRRFSLKDFVRGKPEFLLISRLLGAVAVIHFLWFAAHSGWGVPVQIRGEYVLSSAGRVLKILSRSEYVALKQAQTRMFLTIMIFAYFILTTYWCFSQPGVANKTKS